MCDPVGLTIVVRYSCPLCGLRRAECRVPARVNEGVVDWMDATIRVLAADHATRSPHCRPDRLYDMMIPTTAALKIGGPAVQ